MLKLLADPELDTRPAPAPVAVDVPAILRPSFGWSIRRAFMMARPTLAFPKRKGGNLLAFALAVIGWLVLLPVNQHTLPAFARLARRLGLVVAYSELYLRKTCGRTGAVINYGCVGRRVITDAGVAYLTADMAGGASDINLFKYHGFGTGTTNESAAHTALVTELTTEYAVNSTRPTGSQSSSTNTYTTVGTLTPDSGGTLAITEHGIFSATSSGTMWDRTKFSAVNLDSTAGDSLAATYVATFPSGS